MKLNTFVSKMTSEGHCNAMTKYYFAQHKPLFEKITDITTLIDTSSTKELQPVFPTLVSDIFGDGATNGWAIRSMIEEYRDQCDVIHKFLAPSGPMFRLCYKLLSDPQLKYSFPLYLLPSDVCQMLQQGRYPQYYADLIHLDPQSMQIISLALNSFDYYIFHFAAHLLNDAATKKCWDSRNTIYFILATEYLTHFLNADPSSTVLPSLPHFIGKGSIISPLQSTPRTMHAPSLLRNFDSIGLVGQMNTSHLQPRNDVWRSETVLQAFIDIWLSCPEHIQFQQTNNALQQNTWSSDVRAPSQLAAADERVRIARILVKQLHAYAATSPADPQPCSAALRQYASATLRLKAYYFISYLVKTWPLDASFRLVLELWLSYIQPWRYAAANNQYEKYFSGKAGLILGVTPSEDDISTPAKLFDNSYTQFLAENICVYTTILQAIIPRLLRLDLTVPKNSIMLYRISKVFSQTNLVLTLREIENSVLNQIEVHEGRIDPHYYAAHTTDSRAFDRQISLDRWVGVAKKGISEMCPPPMQYCPLWSGGCEQYIQLISSIQHAKVEARAILAKIENKKKEQNRGFMSFLKFWQFDDNDDDFTLEERLRVPLFLETALQQFVTILGLEYLNLPNEEEVPETSHLEQSSLEMSALSISPKSAMHRASKINYMGDPELIPISAYEVAVLVRILYQISCKINETYQVEMWKLWRRNDIWGMLAREILCEPTTVKHYVKVGPYNKKIDTQELPPRISLRQLASTKLIVWFFIGYSLFYILGYSGTFYVWSVLVCFVIVKLIRTILKTVGMLARNQFDGSN